MQYIKEQTPEICLEIVKNYGESIKKIKKRTPEICFYAFLNEYSLLSYKYIQNGINEFMKSNSELVKDNIFLNKHYKLNKVTDFAYFDIKSFIHLKDYLIKENSHNKYILDDKSDIDTLKEIALSNNELIIIDTGNTKGIHKILANKIIKNKELLKESF